MEFRGQVLAKFIKGKFVNAFAKNQSTKGFAHAGLVAVVVVVILLGAIGYMFYKNIIAKNSTGDASAATSTAQTAPEQGTTASIDQLSQQDAAAEASVDSSSDSQAQQTATSANSVVGNVGGAYDENSL